jgi:hypothetical protein
MASASSSSVQWARPAGGFEQAVATSSASSSPDSFRSAPGRGSSLNAADKLPSTKRRLVRYTVEPPTPTLAAISSSFTPASGDRAPPLGREFLNGRQLSGDWTIEDDRAVISVGLA